MFSNEVHALIGSACYDYPVFQLYAFGSFDVTKMTLFAT